MSICKLCGEQTVRVIDFGEVALAGAFIKTSEFRFEKKYPLTLDFCESCYLLQISDPVDEETLFKNYFYFSSKIKSISNHFRSYADFIQYEFYPDKVLEIGCNDGVLLDALSDLWIKTVGVDPATNVVKDIKRHEIYNEFFTKDTVNKLGKFKVVVANNVFAHIIDINSVTENIKKVLEEDGTLIIEVHDLRKMINFQYDWVYHEHIYYYSATTLDKHFTRHGLILYDAIPIDTHGGSIRYLVSRKGNKTKRLKEMIESEEHLTKKETFIKFGERAKQHALELRTTVERLVKDSGRMTAYGASGRANTILQLAGLDNRHISQVIDDSDVKSGFNTPGTHITILHPSSEKISTTFYTLILAWPYKQEILKKIKNIPIIPL